MRLVTYEVLGEPPQAGVLLDDVIVAAGSALAQGGLPLDPDGVDLLDVLEHWDEAEAILRDAASAEDVVTHPRDEATLLAPLPWPPTVRDFYAFEEHVARSWKRRGQDVPEAWYEVPAFYFSNPSAVVGPDAPVAAPRGSRALDYELEVAWTVDRPLRNPSVRKAEEAILGLTILADWSARDLQKREMTVGLGPSKGKDFATSLGPALVTVDELADRRTDGAFDLAMEARVDGEVLSRGNLKDLHWSLAEMTAHAAQDVTLYPGEVLGTGTVGTGSLLDLGREPGDYLEPGSVVELEVERLGVLRTPIVDRRDLPRT